MCAFWSSVLLMTGRYAGKPMVAHIRLDRLEAAHFRHWLSLFEATVTERCDERQAALLIDRARRIALSLLMGINVHSGLDAGAAARALEAHRPAA